jgi:hypothetical protein
LGPLLLKALVPRPLKGIRLFEKKIMDEILRFGCSTIGGAVKKNLIVTDCCTKYDGIYMQKSIGGCDVASLRYFASVI